MRQTPAAQFPVRIREVLQPVSLTRAPLIDYGSARIALFRDTENGSRDEMIGPLSQIRREGD